MPPLRQRREEIPILLHYAMRKIARHWRTGGARVFALATLTACQEYAWPGNVAELEDFVKRYLAGGETRNLPGVLRERFRDTGWSRRGQCEQQPARLRTLIATLLIATLFFSGTLESSVAEEQENAVILWIAAATRSEQSSTVAEIADSGHQK